MIRGLLTSSILTVSLFATAQALAEPVEIYCTIRKGTALECQTTGKDKKVMTSQDVTNFVDAGEVLAFITLKSKKSIERTFMVDAKSPQYKRLQEIKRSSSISEINKAKADLFNDIEKKVIKQSDELDAQAGQAELVLWDPGITYDKARREQRAMMVELDEYRKNRDKIGDQYKENCKK